MNEIKFAITFKTDFIIFKFSSFYFSSGNAAIELSSPVDGDCETHTNQTTDESEIRRTIHVLAERVGAFERSNVRRKFLSLLNHKFVQRIHSEGVVENCLFSKRLCIL